MLHTRQYFIEFGSSMALYIVVLFFSISHLSANPDSPWTVWVSLLPVLPAGAATVALIRALRKLDELQQQIQLMSFAISFAIVGLATFTYGFLENVGFPHIPYVWVFPFMIATWGLTTPAVALAYR